jgi:iron complex outermembrane receptor protein
LSADQFRSIVNEKGTAAQKALLGTANTNWQDVIYQTAHMTDNNLSIGGEVAKLPYRVSLGFQTQSGVLKTDKLQRTSVGILIKSYLF